MRPAMPCVNAADMLRIRGERNRLLGDHLFLPGAWDILLYLEAVSAAQTARAICQALSMYPSSAERWIGVLRDEGLITAEGGPDGEPAFALTERGRGGVEACLDIGRH